MRTRQSQAVLTAASPATPSTAIVSPTIKNEFLFRGDTLSIDALITAGAGGTLDLYLQRRIDTNKWLDWIHFPQVPAGTTKGFTVIIDGSGSHNNPIVEVGVGTDGAPNLVLPANSIANTMPCLNKATPVEVRLVHVAGAGTSGAGSSTVYISPLTQNM